MEEVYSIKLPVFEGPLDLLLHLINENKVNIYDIPIALITRQYLEFIEMMKELNLDIAGEFLLMAATLIHIKSRMLLPVEEVAGEEPEDPRFELVQRLIEYQAFKEASLALREREGEWSNIFHRKGRYGKQREGLFEGGEPLEGEGELDLFDLSLFDLLGAFKNLLDKASPEVANITRETLTVKDRISFIVEMIEKQDAIQFEELFQGKGSRTYLIVTFVALLEVLRLGLARAYQERDFGTIWIINPQRQTAPEGPQSQANSL
ncbi:MAG TPA: segregation/condensation protein A [Thermodesulfovibrionales bacterium]|nr:segregation/condensation protein A [Thermodesulfovibrionales bacterium]